MFARGPAAQYEVKELSFSLAKYLLQSWNLSHVYGCSDEPRNSRNRDA
jgi:hypothetical protein